jgi:hypothetical protein
MERLPSDVEYFYQTTEPFLDLLIPGISFVSAKSNVGKENVSIFVVTEEDRLKKSILLQGFKVIKTLKSDNAKFET